MAWFKVDDRLHSSRKVLSLPRSVRLSAIGLWALAGSWSAHEELDGYIPGYMVAELGGTPHLVAALTKAGLWEVAEGGSKFSKWHEYQPVRADLELARAKETERKRLYRSRGTETAVPVGHPVGHQEVSGHPDPTRPDPTPIKKKTLVQPTVEHLHDFEMFWEVFPRKQGKADALKAYTAVRKKVDARTVRAGAQAYALLNIGEDKSFLKMAGGWLRGERWADEQIVNATRQTVTGSNERFCDIHPAYPVSARYPCEACSRSIGLSDGREF